MINETQDILKTYAQEVSNLYKTGVTTEHSFRGSLQTLLNSLLPQYSAVNEPQRSACGAPDYALVGKKDRQPHAYVEAKDLFDNDLRGVNAKGHKEQFDRYKQALSRVAFTDYLDFRFVVDGAETAAVSLLKPNAKGGFDIAEGEQFVSILTQWADCSIQPINSARRLAEIMAYKARLLRESIEKALEEEIGGEASRFTYGAGRATSYIHGQFEAFKNILLSDLTPAGFADLYAQTIAYGMFAARLNDPQGDEASRLTNGAGRATSHFSRQEAATLIPFSNPFLRKIFQQIAVFDLDSRIAWIVDDLVEAFAATDVNKIMGRYQQNSLHQDPLIHFYEDFLAAYDPKLRKACGVYYTPQPVVSFIVRAIDEVLIRDFGLADGLADDSKVGGAVSNRSKDDNRSKGKSAVANRTSPTSYLYPHRVQILDPATGTGTFLAEAVRQIYRRFEGNEGLWPQYVEESLRPRLHGFELLMAPYTITHLKLDMMIGGGASRTTCEAGRLTSNPFFDKSQGIEIANGHLPHWHQDGKLQFVTFRLADSLPQEKLLQLKADKELFEKDNPKPWDKETEAKYYKQFGSKIDEWLDAGHGSCVLQFPNVRQVVNEALLHFNGERYILHSYVIMPNHVHVLFEPIGENKTSDILHSWKSFTTHKINKLIGLTGTLWQAESFDRIIRDERHYAKVCQYIKNNPKNLTPSQYTMGDVGGEAGGEASRLTQGGGASRTTCEAGRLTSRLRVYLTNSLEECHPDTGTLFAQWLSNESAEANAIKRDCPVMVMMGNPPYSVSSNNKGEWITRLVDDYKRDLNERNIQPLSDDYIKFIRLGQYYIERNGSGVMGFITNNSYLDGLIHRQMRKTLLEVFDDIYIVNLHGNSKRKETAPDGSKDENVFDIMVGANIAIFVKSGKKGKKEFGEVHYLDLFGTRNVKYDALDSYTLTSAPWQSLECKAPNYFFVPKDFGLEEEYNNGIRVDELFKQSNAGFCTEKDSMNIFFTDEDRQNLLNELQTLSEGELCSKFDLKLEWVKKVKEIISQNIEVEETLVSYRPFDVRFTNYYSKQGLMGRPRYDIMQHLIKRENIAIMCCRQCSNEWRHVLISKNISERCYVSGQSKECGYLFPLYLYDSLGERHLNMREEVVAKILEKVGGEVGGEASRLTSGAGRATSLSEAGRLTPLATSLFAYIYAVLHSPSYRERYKEFLKIDFPRIPQPTDATEYQRLVALGQQLIDLHLMREGGEASRLTCGAFRASSLSEARRLTPLPFPKYPVPGTNTVEAPRFADGRVYINDQQYFDGVTETAWTFFIGGYQPAQKWLKDRRGRTLTLDDIRHYQRIIATLDRTAEIMQEIG